MKIRLPDETMDWVMQNKGSMTMEQFVVSQLNKLCGNNDSKKETNNDKESNITTE